MKTFLALLCGFSLLCADVSVRGNVSLQGDAYLIHPEGKHPDNYTASTDIEGEYTHDAWRAFGRIYAQQDYYDLQAAEEQNGRSFLRVDELYGAYDFEEDQLMAGRSIRFWGALEVRNIVDGFNPSDLRGTPFETDKMGVWNAAWTHYTETGSFALIVKTDEEDQKMAKPPYVYYFFPPNVTYDATLQTEDSRYRPTVYLRYGGSTESDTPLDYALIVQHGYDSQRFFSADTFTPPIALQAHAYLVNKLLTYNTLVLGETLLKLEGVYADVIKTPSISDYYQLGLGIEHTLTAALGDGDLGLIGEYYYYDTLQKGADKYTDLELFEVFQNDLFVGIRYTANDISDTSLVGGAIFDLDYAEQSYYVQAQTRLFDALTMHAEYRYIEPSKQTPTAYHLLGRLQALSLKLGYYF